jgi:nitronate monooxygenase
MFNQKTRNLCNQLTIRLPIIQAPMAGGIVTPVLINEVMKHGGLGFLPLGYLSIDEAREAIRKTAALASNRFGVNIFLSAPPTNPSTKQINTMLKCINKYREALGLSIFSELSLYKEPELDELLEMIISEGITTLSFTFGMLPNHVMKMLQQKGIFVIGTATTVQEGLALEDAGCHAVIAQGYEAGGHRGGDFLEGQPGGFIGTMALVPQMVDMLNIPVIASGGIMDGRGICAALGLGASAVQMGTAFLTCDESGASSMHKQMIIERPENSTVITSVFTGKPARGFNNEFVTTLEKNFRNDELLSYPLQHQLTKELRNKANQLSCAEYAGLWSGQGTRLSRAIPVAKLMESLEKETISAISNFYA